MSDAGDRQRRAADPASSVWVGASAGTGKTKVLVDRVLRLMLADAPPEKILCLTFTKAAAAEMLNRVADELARWATLSESELHEALFALTGEEPDFDLQSKARRLFAKVLDAPGGMRIETIHAFCQSLLRRFPVEAGLAPGFELIEEQDAEDLRRDARRTLLASTEPAIQQAVAAVAARTSEDEFEAVMAALVAERGRLAALVHAAGGVEALSFRIRAALGIGATESEADAIAAFCAHGGCDAEGLKAALAALRIGGAKGDLDKIDRIAAFLAAAPDARGTLLAAYPAPS
jgi:ATP-dependent helicase/nuclease subunit A